MTRAGLEASPEYQAATRAIQKRHGTDLGEWLAAQRGAGLSYGAIAKRLSRLRVEVSYETIRNWCQRLGVNNGAAS